MLHNIIKRTSSPILGTMFSASDQTPTCRADQKSQSKIFSNKTLVGGLEAGRFSFEGVVRYSSFKSFMTIFQYMVCLVPEREM